MLRVLNPILRQQQTQTLVLPVEPCRSSCPMPIFHWSHMKIPVLTRFPGKFKPTLVTNLSPTRRPRMAPVWSSSPCQITWLNTTHPKKLGTHVSVYLNRHARLVLVTWTCRKNCSVIHTFRYNGQGTSVAIYINQMNAKHTDDKKLQHLSRVVWFTWYLAQMLHMWYAINDLNLNGMCMAVSAAWNKFPPNYF